MLKVYTDKSKLIVFSQRDQLHIEDSHYIGKIIKPKVSCRYLGLLTDKKLEFDVELNKNLLKLSTAIRSIYLVRHLNPLKAKIVLFKSPFNFRAIFLQSLSAS